MKDSSTRRHLAAPMPAIGPGDGRLFWLDALRGGAAALVLLSHLRFLWPGAPPGLAHGLALAGQAAVEAFLVLSGFLLARALARPGAPGPLTFWARRLWRIGPLLALAVLLYAAVQPRGPADPPLWQVLTLTAWWPVGVGPHSGFMGFLWALAAEWWAWALLPLLPMRAAPLAAAFLALLGLRWAAVAGGLPWPEAYGGTPWRLDPVLLGALAAVLPASRRPGRDGALALGGFGAHAAWWWAAGPGFPASPGFLAAGFLAAGLGAAGLVRGLARRPAPAPSPWVRGTAALAAVSYPLYLLHLLPVLLIGPQPGAGAALLAAAAVVPAALALAAAAHLAVERPAMRLSPARRPAG